MSDPQSIKQLNNLANALNDIENGVTPQSQTGGETGDSLVESTKLFENLLGKLSNIEGFDYTSSDYSELQANAEFQQNTRSYDPYYASENLNAIYSDESGIENIYEEGTIPRDAYVKPITVTQEPRVPTVQSPKTPWSIISEDVKGLKNVKKYNIQNSYNNQTIIKGIMMKEAAVALLNILNEGGNLSDAKVLGIISYGIQYTRILESALNSVKSRHHVLAESNYSRAAELDTEIADYKTQAQALKEKVLSFIAANGFSTQ